MNRFTLLGLAAILLWSVTVGLARSLSEKVGPLAGGAAVYLVGGAFCLIRLRRQGGRLFIPAGLPRRYLLGCGSLFMLYLLSFYAAIGMAADRVQAIGVGLANYLWPTFTILFSLALLGKRASAWLAPGTAAALVGVLLVMTDGAGVAPGAMLAGLGAGWRAYGLALAGALMWALYSNLTSRWMAERSESAVAYFMLATGAVLLVLRLFGEGGPWSAGAAMEAVCLGLATGAGYECWETAMRRGDVGLVAAWSYSTPVLSTLFSCLYLGVAPGLSLWLGCGLVAAGSLISRASIR